eukprot:362482-Chlamydomonas_euryale.AAC.1
MEYGARKMRLPNLVRTKNASMEYDPTSCACRCARVGARAGRVTCVQPAVLTPPLPPSPCTLALDAPTARRCTASRRPPGRCPAVRLRPSASPRILCCASGERSALGAGPGRCV